MLTVPFALSIPARLEITEPRSGLTAVVDVEEARAELIRSQSLDEPARWKAVGDYLTSKFPEPVKFAENQLIDLNNAVVAIANVLDEERKKKIADCVCSLTSSLESQPNL